MRKYSRFAMIDDGSNLARFFNGIMKGMSTMRMLVAPVSFRKDESIADFQDSQFCEFCRYESWMHAVVERLNDWISRIDEYDREFHGSWKYYAAYHRISAIREFGDDVESDGDAEGIQEEEYKPYSILSVLCDNGWRDIVQDTVPEDIKGLCAAVIANSRTDILEGFKKAFGGNVKAFRQADDGSMRPITQEEHDLDMVSGQVRAEDDAKRIMAIVAGIHMILCMLRLCKHDDDNTEIFKMVRDSSSALLSMDFNALDDTIKLFNGKYAHGEG